jgi:hypothetical protein
MMPRRSPPVVMPAQIGLRAEVEETAACPSSPQPVRPARPRINRAQEHPAEGDADHLADGRAALRKIAVSLRWRSANRPQADEHQHHARIGTLSA